MALRAVLGDLVTSPIPSPAHPHSPSNLPEKLSVARHRFFFLPLFLASGMSMGWLVGISASGDPGMRPTWPLWLSGPTQPSPTVPSLPGPSPGRAVHSRLKSVSPGWACSREKASSKGFCPCSREEESSQAILLPELSRYRVTQPCGHTPRGRKPGFT